MSLTSYRAAPPRVGYLLFCLNRRAQASACLAFLRAAFGLASAIASEPYPYKSCKGRFQRLC
ncbi:hypothetical protein, partial [Sneathiella sp.]|uniref:hypothetical protein n=1 Tax=Sneathiella sp. TaxID=1964365 RepID=UPI002627F4C8